MTVRSDDTSKPPPPFPPSAPAGYLGKRWTVTHMTRDGAKRRIEDGDGMWAWVLLGDLTDPPPLPDDVQQAVDEAVASGIFADPRAAVFGEGA